MSRTNKSILVNPNTTATAAAIAPTAQPPSGDGTGEVHTSPHVPPTQPHIGATNRSGFAPCANTASETSLNAVDVAALLAKLSMDDVVATANAVWKLRVQVVWQTQFRDQYHLSEAEAFAILAFTVEEQPSLYSEVGPLMDCDSVAQSKEMHMVIRLLRSGVGKLPAKNFAEAYRGFAVKEGAVLRDAFEGQAWKTGECIEFARFSSFSASWETGTYFSGDAHLDGILFKVHNGIFREIGALSAVPKENELIEVPPTQYKIQGRFFSKNNLLCITAIPEYDDEHSRPTTPAADTSKRPPEAHSPRSVCYSVRDDETVSRRCYDHITVSELRQLVGASYRSKFKRYGSVTQQLAINSNEDEDHRMQSDKIFTRLTLIEPPQAEDDFTEVTRLDAMSLVENAVRCSECRELDRKRCDACRRLLVVEGRAGIGKTTFAMQLGRVQPSESCVFVVISLSTLGSFLPPSEKPGDVELSMLQLLGVSLSRFAEQGRDASPETHRLVGVDKATVEALWGSHHVPIVWVLDGLDEVNQRSDPRVRGFVTQVLDPNSIFWENRPLDSVIVTSREEKGYFGKDLGKIPMLRIDTWGRKEVVQYVESYFRTNESETYSEKATELLLSSALGCFARLPITCELVCFVVEHAVAGETFPDVASVYERAVSVIYKKTNKRRRTLAAREREADESQVMSVDFADAWKAATLLGLEVARRYQMMESRNDENLDRLGLLVVEIPDGENPQDSLKLSLDTRFSLIHSGWFRHVKETSYQFVHKSFMEYFAACALAANPDELRKYGIDVGQDAQQRNLLVLLATIVIQPRMKDTETKRKSCLFRFVPSFESPIQTLLEGKIVDSFNSHFKTIEKDCMCVQDMSVNGDSVTELSERVGCATVSEVAKVLCTQAARNKKLLAHSKGTEPVPPDQVSSLAAADQRVLPLPQPIKVASPLMDGIDSCGGRLRWISRNFSATKVPIFYSWMIQPMAKQNALQPLMYVQRRIMNNKAFFEKLKENRVYDVALLEAEVARAKHTARFLMSHCDAQLDLPLAAKIGATVVLERELRSKGAGLPQLVNELLPLAVESKQVEATGAIIAIALEIWPGRVPRHMVAVEVASCAAAAGVDLDDQEMLMLFSRHFDPWFSHDKERVLSITGHLITRDFCCIVLPLLEKASRANDVWVTMTAHTSAPIDPHDVAALGLLRTLTVLDVADCSSFGDAHLEALAASQSLRTLKLGGTSAAHSGLLLAAPLMCRLRYLALCGKTLDGTSTDTPVAELITSLDLRNANSGVISQLSSIYLFQNLNTLDLRHSPVTDADLGHLTRCPNLRTVDLEDTKTSDKSILKVSDDRHAITQLRKLDITLPAVGDSNTTAPARLLLPYIHNMPGLHSLGVHGHLVLDDFDVVSESSQVTMLTISLNEDSVVYLTGILRALRNVFPRARLYRLYVQQRGDPAAQRGGDPAAQRGGDPAAHLHCAAEEGHTELCDLLLAHGADVNKATDGGATPLHVASQNGHTSTCKLLLAHRANVKQPDNKGCTPLHIASQNGHSTICELLLVEGKADVEQPNDNGATALHVASENGNTRTCGVLLQAKADVKRTADGGAAPLHLASENGHTATCKRLIAHGAKVYQRNHKGETPLWIASANGHAATCELLLRDGADVNHQRIDGASPLWIASLKGNTATCELLLDKGADVKQMSNSGATPLDVATKNGHTATRELLLARGA